MGTSSENLKPILLLEWREKKKTTDEYSQLAKILFQTDGCGFSRGWNHQWIHHRWRRLLLRKYACRVSRCVGSVLGG